MKKELAQHMREVPTDCVSLWRFPADQFEDWLRKGFGEAESYSEYLARLDIAEAAALELGRRVILCTATPAEMLKFMQQEGLNPASTEDRAAAIGFMALKEMLGSVN